MTVPPPPTGGHSKLRLLEVPANRVWYRISHRRYPSALHFSIGPHARWNDPREAFGVLYVADSPQTAFAETFGHGLAETHPPAADKFISQLELEERHLFRIWATRKLHLGELHGVGLPALNLDG